MPRGKRNPIVPQVPGSAPADETKTEAGSAKPAAPDDHLPDQNDIDRATLRRKVLTKQGWVFPIERPGPQFSKV